MIRYRLRCSNGHDFDAWFRSSDDCAAQIGAGLVACSSCGDHGVEKALMTPGVRTGRQKDAAREVAEAPPAPKAAPVPVAAMPPEATQAIAALRELRKAVLEKADYVGPKFAEEARRIHYGEAEERGIYGEATPDDVRDLTEDGIDIMPLPVLPEDRN